MKARIDVELKSRKATVAGEHISLLAKIILLLLGVIIVYFLIISPALKSFQPQEQTTNAQKMAALTYCKAECLANEEATDCTCRTDASTTATEIVLPCKSVKSATDSKGWCVKWTCAGALSCNKLSGTVPNVQATATTTTTTTTTTATIDCSSTDAWSEC